MLSTTDFPKKQVEAFLQAYQNNPLKAAACSVGLDLYQGYIIAQKHKVLRLHDAIVQNSSGSCIGTIGEELFAKLIPEAVDVNLNISMHNPNYDFLLGKLRIDVKTSSGFSSQKGGSSFVYRFRCQNKFDCDVFVLFVKPDPEADQFDSAAYTHCLVIPSIFLFGNRQVELNARALKGQKTAWSEFLMPIEKLAETIRLLAANTMPLPPDIIEAGRANEELKTEINKKGKK
jgi:hypothetical protein F3_00947